MKKLFTLCACALLAVGLVACGGSSTDSGSGNADFTSVNTAVKDAIVTFLESEGVTPAEDTDGNIMGFTTYDLTTEDLSGLYPTIQAEDFVNGTMYMPLMNTNGDLIIIAEATDAAGVDAIVEAFDGVKDAQLQTWQYYLPEQLEKVENNQIVKNGNFVLYSTFSNDDVVKAFNAATK
ncbi:MAG: DUF4358 domain-containing protein [Culicoidibacterales bacterium]